MENLMTNLEELSKSKLISENNDFLGNDFDEALLAHESITLSESFHGRSALINAGLHAQSLLEEAAANNQSVFVAIIRPDGVVNGDIEVHRVFLNGQDNFDDQAEWAREALANKVNISIHTIGTYGYTDNQDNL